jgi:hypothetical protein
MNTERHQFTLRAEPELFKEIEEEAKKEMRSVNMLICVACREYIKLMKQARNED